MDFLFLFTGTKYIFVKGKLGYNNYNILCNILLYDVVKQDVVNIFLVKKITYK